MVYFAMMLYLSGTYVVCDIETTLGLKDLYCMGSSLDDVGFWCLSQSHMHLLDKQRFFFM